MSELLAAALAQATTGTGATLSRIAAVLSQRPFFPDALYIFTLTALLDAIDLSFGRILWFVRTLRFWLYFILHFALSCVASYLIADKLPAWYLLGFVGTFLGVGVISNADVKVGGQSLVPVGQLFTALKAKMIEQAAEDKAAEVARALLIERLQKLEIPTLEAAFRAALLAGGISPMKIADALAKIKRRPVSYIKDFLIHNIIKTNQRFAEARIENWEAGQIS